ncbi:hypothetical protein LXT21_17525 [Myxococcus sp. K38C18041901]|uniref:InlB B-repeat-containing protein n=1 Tax=Myxococcus guangdongensis TaxID=2906760 RepID=UPI0020A6EECA|nr:alpha/beta hydrolase-fold protein [Myxococcus guangdongensis]MCP3060586.1 hypothetical protein [Myxococcus guangdongensis]
MRSVVLHVALVLLAACGPGVEEGFPQALDVQRSAVSITVENQIVTRLPGASGATLGYSEYLPPGYLTSTQRYPAIIHLNGMGELGRATTESELYTITTKHGALANIRTSATWKTYFGNKQVMVFAPQSVDNYSPTELRPFIQFIVANYRVDPTRVYLTGLSMGGWGTWRYAHQYGTELAAIAPFATNIGAPGDTLTSLKDVAVWASSSYGEVAAQQSWLVGYTKVYGASQVVGVPEPTQTTTYQFDKTTKAWTSQTGAVGTGSAVARLIVLTGSAHTGWTQSYSTQAFWDWMLAQQRGTTPAPVTYALTVNAGSGDGQYASGTQVTITADAPASGQVFDKWTGATVASATSATTTLTMPAAATTVTATYRAATTTKYTLTVNAGSGDGQYTSGTQVTITADAPATGYVFDRWTGATVASATSATTTLSMPAAATTVTATYRQSTSGLPITVEDQVIGRLTSVTGTTYAYGEYLPPGYLTSPTTTYPVVIHLHDSGEIGTTSTEAQLVEVVSRYGPLQLIRSSATWKTYFGGKKALVFAPRASANWDPAQLDALVDFLVAQYRVDTSRIYITGRVLGGSGAWNYAYQHGDRIAALAPVGANLGGPGPALSLLTNVPVWMVDAWVTANAGTAQHSWLRGLTKAYGWDQFLTFPAPTATLTYLFDASNDTWSTQPGAHAAGTSPIRFTVHPQGTTDFGTPTYQSQSFWDWMFAQHRP